MKGRWGITAIVPNMSEVFILQVRVAARSSKRLLLCAIQKDCERYAPVPIL